MGAIISGSIDIKKLPKEKFIKGKNGSVWYQFTISVNDETRYGNNVAFMDSQTKEEREAKVARNYLGNGKVIWTDDKITLAEREDQPAFESVTKTQITEPANDDLPF